MSMSSNAQYLKYLVEGGNFSDLPKPDSVMGAYLYELCKKGMGGTEKLVESVEQNSKDIKIINSMLQGQIYDFEQVEHSGVSTPPQGAKYESLLQAKGNTNQKTYAGYQMLTILFDGQEKSEEWGTWSVDSKGIYVTTTRKLSQYERIISENITQKLEVGKTYYFKSSLTNLNGKIYGQINIKHSDGTNKFMQNGMFTFAQGDTADFVIQNATDTSTVFGQIELTCQLEEGTTAHDYEPYVGGVASPNVNYPQDVVGVEELNIGVYESRNLVSELIPRKGWSGSVCTLDNGKRYSLPLIKDSVHDFTIQWVEKSEHLSTPLVVVIRYYKDDKCVGSITNKKSGDNILANAYPHDSLGITFYRSDDTLTSFADDELTNIMVEYGTTKHSYEPYKEPKTHKIIPPRPLHKLGDDADFLDVESGQYKYKIGIYNSTKDIKIGGWQLYRQNDNEISFVQWDALTKYIYSEKKSACTHLKNENCWVLANKGFSPTSEKGLLINCYKKEIATVADLQKFLQNNEVIFYFVVIDEETEPIASADLAFLKELQGIDVSTVTITDQNGNDVTFLMEYIIKLSERVSAYE